MWEAMLILDFLDRGRKASITGPNLIRDTYEKVDLIWKRLLKAQS